MRVEFRPVALTEQSDIFSILLEGNKQTEFQKFLIMFKDAEDPYLKEDYDRIVAAIQKITDTGAIESFFRNEGKMSDRVCAIPLLITSRNKAKHGTLRLYCIRVSDTLLIVGGGGIKSSATYEENPDLLSKVRTLQSIDSALSNIECSGVKLNDELFNLVIEVDYYGTNKVY